MLKSDLNRYFKRLWVDRCSGEPAVPVQMHCDAVFDPDTPDVIAANIEAMRLFEVL